MVRIWLSTGTSRRGRVLASINMFNMMYSGGSISIRLSFLFLNGKLTEKEKVKTEDRKTIFFM